MKNSSPPRLRRGGAWRRGGADFGSSPDFSPRLRNGGVGRGRYAAFLAIPPAVTPNNLYGRATAIFVVRELAPAFPTADLSAVDDSPRRVAASKSGDESPHSESPFRRAMVRSPG